MRFARPGSPGFYGLLCALIVGFCAMLSRPFVDMGVYDDWSYIKTATDFARTGHILYNGWATAMLGWQIIWGALFVKLFGASFTAVRLSTLPVAMVTVYLFHEILRRFGISERNAMLGTLTLGLSPPFLFFSVTFMSDIPGLFCIVLCLYLCQRAIQAQSDSHTVIWLLIAGLTNTVGGTVRQIAWLGVLVMIPCTGWILRKRHGALLATILVWAIGLAGIYLSLHWFLQQPYSIPEKLIQAPVTPRAVLHLLRQMSRVAFSLPLLTLPVLIAWLTAGSFRSRKRIAALSIGLLSIGAFLLILGRHHNLDPYLAPWLGNPASRQGMFDFVVLLGDVPQVMSIHFRILLSLVVVAATVAFVDRLFNHCSTKAAPDSDALIVRWREIFILVGPFTLAYIALLMPRAAFQNLFNRYLLAPLAVVILLLLLYFQEHISSQLPAWTTIMLALFAVYSIAGTHDVFATNRARLAVANTIESTGVPRTAIDGGGEYDSWTQVMTQGYINEPRLQVPKGAYHAVVHAPDKCRYWFLDETPVIHPEYVMVFTPQHCLAPSRFSPTTFHTWLPPFRETIYVQQTMKPHS